MSGDRSVEEEEGREGMEEEGERPGIQLLRSWLNKNIKVSLVRLAAVLTFSFQNYFMSKHYGPIF